MSSVFSAKLTAMKIKRKIIATLLTVLGFVLVLFSILLFLGFFKKQKAGILIESDPPATVYIDSIEVGVTPYESEINPGEITVKLVPEGLNELNLDDYETKVDLISGIKTIIKRNFNQNEESSSGAVVSFETTSKDESTLVVVSIPDNAQIFIDSNFSGATPYKGIILTGEHKLVVSSEGYVDTELPIIAYKGYKLTAFVKLAKIDSITEPLQIVEDENIDVVRIRIKKVDDINLVIREGASVGFPEVGQVRPDEVYDVLEEGENGKWYKIQIPATDEKESVTGWISSEFVTKI